MPYFYKQPFPPKASYIHSGFFVESGLIRLHDPFAYFTRATYLPFASMKNIRLVLDPGRYGISEINMNVPDSARGVTIQFPRPPDAIKFTVCGITVAHRHTFRYPFIQVCYRHARASKLY